MPILLRFCLCVCGVTKHLLLQPSLQERTQWLLWKLLSSLRTPGSRCRPSVLANTWRYNLSQYTISKSISYSIVGSSLVLIFWCFLIYSLTRRQSPLQTSVVSPLRSLTQRGTWGCCWVSTPPTWPRAPPCPPWRLNVPVGSMILKQLGLKIKTCLSPTFAF